MKCISQLTCSFIGKPLFGQFLLIATRSFFFGDLEISHHFPNPILRNDNFFETLSESGRCASWLTDKAPDSISIAFHWILNHRCPSSLTVRADWETRCYRISDDVTLHMDVFLELLTLLSFFFFFSLSITLVRHRVNASFAILFAWVINDRKSIENRL